MSEGKLVYWCPEFDEPVSADSVSELAQMEDFEVGDVHEICVARMERGFWAVMLPDGIGTFPTEAEAIAAVDRAAASPQGGAE